MAEIRVATDADAAACRDIYAPYVRDSAITFETTVPSVPAFGDRLTDTLETHPWLVCEHDGSIHGYAYASAHRGRDAYQWAVESSVYVAETARRAGVARGLYTSLFELLRRQGFYTVYAGITVPNPPSAAFHESVGFEPVGTYENVGYKHGAWHDVEWWAHTLQDRSGEPTAPVPFDSLDPSAVESDLGAGEGDVSL